VETGSFGTERLQRRKKEGIRKRKGQETSVISLGRYKVIDRESISTKLPWKQGQKRFSSAGGKMTNPVRFLLP
jgi:hypothetical protein